MTPKKVIATKKLSRVFFTGDLAVYALNNVNIAIEEGEFVAIFTLLSA